MSAFGHNCYAAISDRYDARRDAESGTCADRKAEAKKTRERVTSRRVEQLCADSAWVGDTICDFMLNATYGARDPSSMLKAQEIAALVMEGGSGEEVCDMLRAIVEAKAAEKADDEYSDTFGDDE